MTTISKTTASVRTAQLDDRETVGRVLTAAFFDDPVTDWIVPDREHRSAVMPPVFELYFDVFEPHGEVYCTGDGAGAAL